MPTPLMRIPYTGALPPPTIIPKSAITPAGAIAALCDFLSVPSQRPLQRDGARRDKTVLLTGAGISVASGLADYRGTNGTYTLNKSYRPIYFNEFVSSHEARKRYWARSFLGWNTLHAAKPNVAHAAVERLGRLGKLTSVITQNVDSFHPQAHPHIPTLELHGYLRSAVCLSCHKEHSRATFQEQLSLLNPAWANFLAELLASGALQTEHPEERRKKGLKTNPDGDVDLPDAPYTTFRYPPCPFCLNDPRTLPDGQKAQVHVDKDGAWLQTSTAGVLKPNVIMFGESIPTAVKTAAEEAIDEASRVLVIGSSLATYSAWRLIKRAKDADMPIGILNMGGVRGEDSFFVDIPHSNTGQFAVRVSQDVTMVLPKVADALEEATTLRRNVRRG